MTEYNADKAQENVAREEAAHEEALHNKTTQEKSAQILLEDMGDLKKYRSLLRSIYYAVLRLFAPLL